MLISKIFIGITTITVLLISLFLSYDPIGDYFLPSQLKFTFTDTWGFRDSNDKSVNQIRIKVPEVILNRLKEKIKNRVGSTVLSESNFTAGFNAEYHDKLMNYWLNNYNWQIWEDKINQLPHYFTIIKGLQIHFIHIKPKVSNKKVIPILLLHGWPGSFFEFYKLIPLLQKSSDDPFDFEIVCPSLVGYGWSDRSPKPGMNIKEMSHVMFLLMNRLNIRGKFYIQGGDYGSMIARTMAVIDPDSVAGIHLNFIDEPVYDLRYWMKLWIGSFLPTDFHFLTKREIDITYPYTDKLNVVLNSMGYFWIQATRPTTIGIALSDSPTGLAAYIIEKFGAWSNNLTYHLTSPHGGLETIKISIDEMLTNVMIYYVTNSISSSVMLYKEVLTDMKDDHSKVLVHVPTGVAAFPNEIVNSAQYFVRMKYRNIIQYNYMPRGGHFAALEEPELLTKDIKSFIKLVEIQ